ncbi:MAG: N-acetyl-gamma-glutamyl-phosphate reductase [Bacteroidetes bacterium]|nr:N-acetyl-gamma-glutamyl-phosphate reductase [Bacteroidota bacterium]
MIKVGILHGAGYVGRKLIEQVLAHPAMRLDAVTSRSHENQPIWTAHSHLRGRTDLLFTANISSSSLDLVFVAAGHGQGAKAVCELLDKGFEGLIVDMSADFRIKDAATYQQRYGAPHPRPELLKTAWYGMPEITGPPPAGTRLIANPGCFASALSLALYPLSKAGITNKVAVTALTGASGSGAIAKDTTHFPSRNGNVKAYKVFEHQHEAEIDQMAPGVDYSFVPISGPWTDGIWGVAQLDLGAGSTLQIANLFQSAYGDCPLVRLWPDQLPELHYSVGSPFTDIGWIQKEGQVAIGFAIDNLLKGAASQAIQNVNLALGMDQTTGLLP